MTDLASSIIGGANAPGDFVIETPQRILYDARRSYINFHFSHTGHTVNTTNQSGDAPFWPMVAPFKDGWIAYQQVTPWIADPHLSTAGPVEAKFIRYDWAGQVVWETAKNSTIGAVFNSGSDRFMAGNDTHILVRRSGQNFYLLDMSADDGTYSLGSLAFTLSTTNFEQIDGHSGGYTAHKVTGGWIIFGVDLNGASSTVSVAGLDEDFNLLGVDTEGGWNSTDWRRPFLSVDWNGTGPTIAQRYADTGGSTRLWDVAFDGTAAPVISAATTTTLDQNTATGAYRGAIGNGMYDYQWTATNQPLYWVPSDGTESITQTNPYEWVFSDFENLAWRGSGHSLISPSVIDSTNTVAPSSHYYGDRYASQPHNVRHLWVDWATKTSGYVDIHLALPADATPGVSFSYGMGYDDIDLDESCFAIENPTTGKVFFWTNIYWREQPQSDGCGDPCGDNTLVSYWIGQLGTAYAPPEPPSMPEWVNFFDLAGVSSPDCPMLGSGSHDVFLYDRGGARRIAKITDTSLIRWRRKRDDISDATVVVEKPNPECCAVLSGIAVGRHELVIFRNGERVWEGPITRLAYRASSVEIVAHDICHYLSRTIMRRAYDNRYSTAGSKVAPVTHRAQVILANELVRKENMNPSYNILKFLDVRTHAQTTRTSRFTHAYASSVWEELDYMAAKLSLDYTAVGRRLLLNDVHDVIGRTEMLTDKDFNDELVITSYGMELATRSAVTDGEGRWAAVGGVDDFYGEVELLHTMYGEEVRTSGTTPTAAELKALMAEMSSQAQRNLAGRYPVPTVVRIPDSTRLDPQAPVTIDQLVPGVRVPIRATMACLVVEQEQKLDYLSVEQMGNGETVSITLSPAPGTTPWDDSSETAGDEEEEN